MNNETMKDALSVIASGRREGETIEAFAERAKSVAFTALYPPLLDWYCAKCSYSQFAPRFSWRDDLQTVFCFHPKAPRPHSGRRPTIVRYYKGVGRPEWCPYE